MSVVNKSENKKHSIQSQINWIIKDIPGKKLFFQGTHKNTILSGYFQKNIVIIKTLYKNQSEKVYLNYAKKTCLINNQAISWTEKKQTNHTIHHLLEAMKLKKLNFFIKET